VLFLSIIALFIWTFIFLAPYHPWSTKESFEPSKTLFPQGEKIDVLIPARNEEDCIGKLLTDLKCQNCLNKIIIIDDQSSDLTADVARSSGLRNLLIVNGTEPPNDWTGKVWALEQGLKYVTEEHVILLDADISLKENTIDSLLEKLKNENLTLLSIMATLKMKSLWDYMLIPTFIYFFKLLYPFALVNNPKSKVAAAAGGVILLKTRAIRDIGGFSSIKNVLIDDCNLAKKIKNSGGTTWLGLSKAIRTRRPYYHLKHIWNMVARTAFSQLKYSSLLLLLCTKCMITLYLAPILGLFSSSIPIVVFSSITIILMIWTFIPTLKYYQINLAWSVLLPVNATLFLLMTWTSACRYWNGEKSKWKDRTYNK